MPAIKQVPEHLPKTGTGLKLLRVLQIISRFVGDLLLVVWVNRVVAIGLLILFLILWKANQGQDLLVNLNSRFKAEAEHLPSQSLNFIGRSLGPALFYLALTVLALLNWFLPKYFANKDPNKITWHHVFIENWNYGRNKHTLYQRASASLTHHVFISRLIGVLTFVIPACAVLNVLNIFEVKHHLSDLLKNIGWTAYNVLGAFMLLFVLLLYPFFDSRKPGTFCRNLSPHVGNNVLEETFEWLNKRRMTWLLIVVVVSLTGLTLGFGFRNSGHPQDLFWLFIGLMNMAFVFALVVSIRRRLGCKRTGRLHMFWHKVRQYNLNALVLWSGVVFAAIFVLFNVLPFLLVGERLSRTTTITVVLAGVVFYTMLFTLLILSGRKWKVNLAGGLLLLMVVAAIVWDNDFHDVQSAPVATSSERVALETHLEEWLKAREGEIATYNQSNRKYPVVLVNTHGGGIRAAAWTSMAVAYLDSKVSSSEPVVKGETFQRHVLSYSGASGGTVGASVLCAFRKGFGGSHVIPAQTLLDFYQNDFLTPVVVALLGRDALFSTLNIGSRSDRAKLQTQLWEQYLHAYVPDIYAQEYSSLWPSTNAKARTDIPLLFSNSFHLESGQKAIIAPVKLEQSDFVASILVSDLLVAKEKMISLSTGSFLSARFPYISPAGKLDSAHHFLDGGIRENSGAETSREIYTVLERVSSKHGFKDKIEVICLSLVNEGDGDPKQVSKNVFELTAPAVGIYNVRVGNAAKAEAVNQSLFAGRYFKMYPVVDTICLDGKGYFKPVLPLGWQISYPALVRLQRSLESEEMKKRLSPLLTRFRAKPCSLPSYNLTDTIL